MTAIERKRELLESIRKSVIAYDEIKCAALCRLALEEGLEARQAILEGLAAAMDQVGELYSRKEYFVPELLLCSDALQAGLKVLRPHLAPSPRDIRAKILLGVVEGDNHDIGKNLVKAMFEAAGWTVFDLGKNVTLERFMAGQQKFRADVVALSALMTTSMLAIPKVVEALKGREPGVKILVGGAPLNPAIARKYGADGYAPDAGTAVQEARKLLG